MASTGTAAHSKTPSRAQVAAFYKLVDKATAAKVLKREARLAETSAEAADEARKLFGPDSLVWAKLQKGVASALSNMMPRAEGDGALFARLVHDVGLTPLYRRRFDDNTLLNVRQEETDFQVESLRKMGRSDGNEVSLAQLRTFAVDTGAGQLVEAATLALRLLLLHEKQRCHGVWRVPQHEIDALHRLVLDALDIIPRARNVTVPVGIQLVSVMEKTVLREPGCLPAFRDALLIKWSSREVR